MSDAWVGAEFWEPQAAAWLNLDEILERCEVIDVGGDGGGLDDLLGLAVVGREAGTRRWFHWAHAWAHPSVLERRKSEAPRLKDLEAIGDLTLVKRIGDDVEQFAAIVKRINETGLLDKVGLDPAGIGSVLDALADAGVEEDKIVGISQAGSSPARSRRQSASLPRARCCTAVSRSWPGPAATPKGFRRPMPS